MRFYVNKVLQQNRYIHRFPRENSFYLMTFIQDLMKGDIESCLERTRSFFASIPYDLENKTEKHYQTIFYLLFRLMVQYVDAEVKSAVGRADVVVRLTDAVYVSSSSTTVPPKKLWRRLTVRAMPFLSKPTDGRCLRLV